MSPLNDPGINAQTGEDLGAPLPESTYMTNSTSTVGYVAFQAYANFREGSLAANPNQNGVVFFPGSTPVYLGHGILAGGLGVSGDGVNQDDFVTYNASIAFAVNETYTTRADETFYHGVRLSYYVFPRDPTLR